MGGRERTPTVAWSGVGGVNVLDTNWGLLISDNIFNLSIRHVIENTCHIGVNYSSQ